MLYSDKELIELLSSKDTRKNDQGIETLYKLFFPMITTFIFKNSGAKEDVEEVFQDGALVLYVKCQEGGFKLSSKLKTYFYSICRNIWLKSIRRRKPPVIDIQDIEEEVAIEASFFQLLLVNEERDAMLELIKKLGDNCQQLLLLFYYERLKLKEITKRMNFSSDQTVRNKKSKCLKRLNTFLDDSPFFKEFFQNLTKG